MASSSTLLPAERIALVRVVWSAGVCGAWVVGASGARHGVCARAYKNPPCDRCRASVEHHVASLKSKRIGAFGRPWRRSSPATAKSVCSSSVHLLPSFCPRVSWEREGAASGCNNRKTIRLNNSTVASCPLGQGKCKIGNSTENIMSLLRKRKNF